jgi:hypothetical protein
VSEISEKRRNLKKTKSLILCGFITEVFGQWQKTATAKHHCSPGYPACSSMLDGVGGCKITHGMRVFW